VLQYCDHRLSATGQRRPITMNLPNLATHFCKEKAALFHTEIGLPPGSTRDETKMFVSAVTRSTQRPVVLIFGAVVRDQAIHIAFRDAISLARRSLRSTNCIQLCSFRYWRMASAPSSSAVRCCASAAVWISAISGSGSEIFPAAMPISFFELTALV
jgi:hypothetical protein